MPALMYAPTVKEQPIVLPPEMRGQQFRYAFGALLGLVGGVSIASWGSEHLFVEGLEAKERRTIIGIAGVGLAAYGIVKLMNLDEKWLDVAGTWEKAQQMAAQHMGK